VFGGTSLGYEPEVHPNPVVALCRPPPQSGQKKFALFDLQNAANDLCWLRFGSTPSLSRQPIPKLLF